MPLSTRDLIAVAEKRDEEAKRLFAKYDADGSGTIHETDILTLLDDLGLTRKLKQDQTNFIASCFANVGSEDGVLPYPKFRAFYNAAIDDSNGKGKLAKKPSAADQKRASMAASCLASSKAEAHPLFPNVQPANSAELADFSRRLRKFMVTHGLEEAEWAKLMAMMDDQVPGKLVFEDLQSFVRRTEPKGLGLDADSMPDAALQRVWVALDGRRGVVTQDQFGWLMKLVRVEEAGSTAGTGKAAEGVRAEECAEGDSVEKKEDVAEEDKGEKASGVVAPVGGADGGREGSAETEAGERADTEGRAKGAVTVGAEEEECKAGKGEAEGEEKVEEAEKGGEKADAKIEKEEGKSAEEEEGGKMAEEERAGKWAGEEEGGEKAEEEEGGKRAGKDWEARGTAGETRDEVTREKAGEKEAEKTEEATEAKEGKKAAETTGGKAEEMAIEKADSTTEFKEEERVAETEGEKEKKKADETTGEAAGGQAVEKAQMATGEKEGERVAETEGDGAAKTSEEATRAKEGENVVETTIEKKLEKAAENTEEAGEKVGEEAADETKKATKMGAKAAEDKVPEDAGATG